MKKISILIVAMLCMALNIKAGGLMTNTNYHIAFDRMMARGASFDIDAAFSNPAGLAWGTKVGNYHSTSRNLGRIAISS